MVALLRESSNDWRIKQCSAELSIQRFDTLESAQRMLLEAQPEVVHTACSNGREGETNAAIELMNFEFGLAVLETLLEASKASIFINTGTLLESSLDPFALNKK